MTECNLKALATALYDKQSDFMGANHGDYCIYETVKVLQSFEDKIKELKSLLGECEVAFDSIQKEIMKSHNSPLGQIIKDIAFINGVALIDVRAKIKGVK